MTSFQLNVEKFDCKCRFQLSWETRQLLIACLPYPENVIDKYVQWERIYLSYYRSGCRAILQASGTLPTPTKSIDWPHQLFLAQSQLLSEFNYWLRSADLFDIREKIRSTSSNIDINTNTPEDIKIFIACTPIELERLPWESWEIKDIIFPNQQLKIVRRPMQIQSDASASNRSDNNDLKSAVKERRNRYRILTILGDDRGLNFEKERQAIQYLSPLAEVKFIGWQPDQPDQNTSQLKNEIINEISSDLTWHILLFLGHSNETNLTGGELGIAPNVSISIAELIPSLKKAKENGLKFALFNSCSGLSIANTLIDSVGLNQVAIMRQPINNKVAATFLIQFLQKLASYQDVQSALTAACQHFEAHQTDYPSAYLIPSLYCYPEVTFFQLQPIVPLQPKGLKYWLNQLKPTKKEWIALILFTLLSLWPTGQDWLLGKRVLGQAVYRRITQPTAVTNKPPVLLVTIDDDSINKSKLLSHNSSYTNRVYLANLLEKVAINNNQIIGLDYLLDDQTKDNDDKILQKTIEKLQTQNETKLVFASVHKQGNEWLSVSPKVMANPEQTLEGHIHVNTTYLSMPSCTLKKYAFAYVLAGAVRLRQFNSHYKSLQVAQNIKSDSQGLMSIIHNYSCSKFINRNITLFSYKLQQMWLHPIFDFSIEPAQIYETLPAWKIMENQLDSPSLELSKYQVIIIAPGDQVAIGGINQSDRFPLPDALNFWFNYNHQIQQREYLIGGEIHAYMVHHFLQERVVIPVPDFWLLVAAIVLGKLGQLYLKKHDLSKFNVEILISVYYVCLTYGLISYKIYMVWGWLFPWLLPTATLLFYASESTKEWPKAKNN